MGKKQDFVLAHSRVSLKNLEPRKITTIWWQTWISSMRGCYFLISGSKVNN